MACNCGGKKTKWKVMIPGKTDTVVDTVSDAHAVISAAGNPKGASYRAVSSK